jgi:hypothetical protein
VLPELSRKQELRHIRNFEALTASGLQASKLMNPPLRPEAREAGTTRGREPICD